MHEIWHARRTISRSRNRMKTRRRKPTSALGSEAAGIDDRQVLRLKEQGLPGSDGNRGRVRRAGRPGAARWRRSHAAAFTLTMQGI